MRMVYENEYEKIVSNDVNNLQLALNKGVFDDFLYNYFGQPSQGVLGSASFVCSYVSALAASLSVGTGFYYDSTQTGFNPNFRMIQAAAAVSVPFAAASTSDRIDLVCLAPNFLCTATASRFVKTGGTGPVALQTINKTYQDSYTLQVVEGTPGASPVAPSVPTGYIPIAKAYIHANTGMGSGADITDLRTVLAGNTATLTSPIPVTGNTNVSSGVNTYLCSPSGSSLTMSLGPASSNGTTQVTFKNTALGGSKTVVVSPDGSDDIEGANSSITLNPGDILTIACDGTAWWQINGG